MKELQEAAKFSLNHINDDHVLLVTMFSVELEAKESQTQMPLM